MGNLSQSLDELMQIDGATAAAVVDSNSGMVLGKAGGAWTWMSQAPATRKWCGPR